MDRKKWGYSYLAPLNTQQDHYMLHIDVNTTFETTTKQIGPAILIDFSRKVKNMDDGWYHIRYYRMADLSVAKQIGKFATKDGKYIPF